MIGIDIFQISRVEGLLERKNFFSKFFTEKEIEYIESRNRNIKTIAGLIAAKEAVSKSFGIGLSKDLGLKDIEILHNENNAPYIEEKNQKINNLLNKLGVNRIYLNISHDGEYAIAVCKLTKGFNDSGIDINLPSRSDEANKYDFGKVLIIGGSKGMSGSVLLASEASLKAGAGLVYVLVPECISDIVEYKSTEQIILSMNDDGEKEFGNFKSEDLLNIIQNRSIIAIGPGLGKSRHSKKILEIVLNNFTGPIIIDADAIDILSDNLDMIRENLYLTPHEMEFSKLSGYTLNEIKYDRSGFVSNFIDRYDINLLLKGKNSIVANKDNLFINPTGNNGMATAGTGDVLTGIISAFLVRDNTFEMFKLACFVHGLAGDYAAYKYGKTSLMARNIIEFLPKAIGDIYVE